MSELNPGVAPLETSEPIWDDRVRDLARELYDRFVMGGWEPQDAYPLIQTILRGPTNDCPACQQVNSGCTSSECPCKCHGEIRRLRAEEPGTAQTATPSPTCEICNKVPCVCEISEADYEYGEQGTVEEALRVLGRIEKCSSPATKLILLRNFVQRSAETATPVETSVCDLPTIEVTLHKIISEAATQRATPVETASHIETVISLAVEYDCTHHLMFYRDDDGSLRVAAQCSDCFYWGCADCEEITPDNISVYKQTLADCEALPEAASSFPVIYADELFAARVRKMRPQGASYPHYPVAMWPLFDACGPERECDDGNPKKRPI